MNKNKIQQIICGGTLIATTLNMTPAFAYQKENTTLIKVESNDIAKDSIQLLSDSYDDEDFEVEQYGQIIVKHVDIDTGKEIYSRDVYDDVPYGETKVYSRLNVSGYVLQDDRIKTANVSASNPIVTIVFKYKSTTPSVTPPETTTPPVTPPATKPTTPNTGTGNNGFTQKPSTGTSSNNNTSTQKPSTGTNNTTQNSNVNNSANTQKPTTSNSVVDDKKVEVAAEEENVVLGSVTINYVNINTGEVFKTVKEDNLSLTGSYTYSGTDEIGYTLHDKSTKTVTLSEDNPNVVINFNYIKNDSVAMFGRSRLQEACDNNEGVTVYSRSGSVSINESLLRSILSNTDEDIILDISDEVSSVEAIEKISETFDMSVLSSFSISSNLDGSEFKENITITKDLGEEYNNKTVHLYRLSANDAVDYIGGNVVIDGNVSFDTMLPSTDNGEDLYSAEYFISDVKFDEESEEITVVAEVQDESSSKSSSPIILYVTAAVASVGAIFGGIKLLNRKK